MNSNGHSNAWYNINYNGDNQRIKVTSIKVRPSNSTSGHHFSGRVHDVFFEDTLKDNAIYEILREMQKDGVILGFNAPMATNHSIGLRYVGQIETTMTYFNKYFIPEPCVPLNASAGYGVGNNFDGVDEYLDVQLEIGKPKQICDCGALKCGHSDNAGPGHAHWCAVFHEELPR